MQWRWPWIAAGQDVELLAAVGAVAVAEQPELLEDVERPVDGRWDRLGVDRAAALDQLGAGHVAVGLRQDLDQRASLRRPAQAARAEPLAHVGPARGRTARGAIRMLSSCESIDERRNDPQMQHVAISQRVRLRFDRLPERTPRVFDLIGATAAIAPTAVNLGVLLTGLLLGIRHGIDWDHIAAITDITSTTAAAGMADAAHAGQHATDPGPPARPRRRRTRCARTTRGPGGATVAPGLATRPAVTVGATCCRGQGEAIRLGTLYALGHGAVVIALGLAAIAFGALLPDWLDPIMGRDRRLHPRRPRRCG